MRARFIERKSVAFAAAIDRFCYTRNNLSLANRSALMRAPIEIGVEFALNAENSDCRFSDVNYNAPAFRHLFAGPHVNALRCGWHIAPKLEKGPRKGPELRKSWLLYVEN